MIILLTDRPNTQATKPSGSSHKPVKGNSNCLCSYGIDKDCAYVLQHLELRRGDDGEGRESAFETMIGEQQAVGRRFDRQADHSAPLTGCCVPSLIEAVAYGDLPAFIPIFNDDDTHKRRIHERGECRLGQPASTVLNADGRALVCRPAIVGSDYRSPATDASFGQQC